jgi:EAL domain-containing protein (putative c-di-GMP-specific phosphodiesterase class I)
MGSEGRRPAMNSRDEAALISRVLTERAIFPVYQPIVDLATRTLVGVEALARGPAGSPLEFPDALFSAAARAGLMPQLDQLSFTRAAEISRTAGDLVPPLVFINAEPAGFTHPPTPEFMAEIAEPRSSRIVMELTERALAAHPTALLIISNSVHQRGGALALDDVGADPLSMAFLPLLEPEVVKLDMHLLRHPNAGHTIETTATISAYADRTGAMMLAEGIETEADLLTAQALGARWGQGWLFARPGPLSALADWPVHHSARLRPARPDLHNPAGTPFSIAAARHHVRTGDKPMLDALTEYLLRQATSTGANIVVLGAYPDPVTAQTWLPRLISVAETAAFVGIVGPAFAGTLPPSVRIATAPVRGPASTETVLAVVGSQAAAALLLRPGDGDDADFVLTHNRDLVHTVARMLLLQLDSATERFDPLTPDHSRRLPRQQPAGR